MANHSHTPGDGSLDVFAILDAANDLLDRVDFSRLLTDEIMTANSRVSTLAGRARLVQTRLATRVQELSDEKRVAPPEDILGRENGMGNEAAARISRYAKLLADFPAFKSALSDGAISDGHLDALATHVRLLAPTDQTLCLASDSQLARIARNRPVEEFRRHLAALRRQADDRNKVPQAKRVERRNTMSGGVGDDLSRWVFNLNLDPIAGERLNTALTVEMRRLRNSGELDPEIADHPERLRAVALSNLVSVGFQTGKQAPSDAAVVEVGILIDAETFANGLHEHTVCETRTGLQVDVDTAKRLACAGCSYRAVLDADGIIIDLSAHVRLATPEHRRALRTMYRTCAVYGCHTPFHRCEIHHIQPYNGSNTILSNLAPLCVRHHHLVHDKGWTAHLTDKRVLTLRNPNGDWDTPQPLRPLTDTPTATPTPTGTTTHPGTTTGTGAGASSPPGNRPGRPPDRRPGRPPGEPPGRAPDEVPPDLFSTLA
jgi:hypothetical protein